VLLTVCQDSVSGWPAVPAFQTTGHAWVAVCEWVHGFAGLLAFLAGASMYSTGATA
jgi:hypothetical protein